MRRKIRKNCEICTKMILSRFGDTVCRTCDKQLGRDQAIEARNRETNWAAKYKCLGCRAALPMSRARHCLICLPPENHLKLDSDYDRDSIYHE